MELLDSLLTFQPALRLNAQAALKHRALSDADIPTNPHDSCEPPLVQKFDFMNDGFSTQELQSLIHAEVTKEF
jgi:hypothetical protein